MFIVSIKKKKNICLINAFKCFFVSTTNAVQEIETQSFSANVNNSIAVHFDMVCTSKVKIAIENY